MKAGDFVIDFINYLFLVGLGVFCFFYFVAGNHFPAFAQFMKALVPLAIFGIFFLILVKVRRKDIQELAKKGSLNETILCLTNFDQIKDGVVIFSLPAIILGLGFFSGGLDQVDILQAAIVFGVMFFWRRILFWSKDNFWGKNPCLTYYDRTKDEVVIFSLPLITTAAALASKKVDMVDFYQILAVFLVMYLWHKVLFKV